MALSLLFAVAASAATPVVQSVSSWKANAAPMGWSKSVNRIVYNARGADGMFDAYSANPDGSDPKCLTCTIPSFSGVGTATSRGATDVSPDGRYLLVEVESSVHAGAIGAAWTEPGKGGANNVWLETIDGTQAWQLTNIGSPAEHAWGTNWARFDRTGNKIVYASMTNPAVGNLGYWQLKVANIAWTGGVPSLGGITSITTAASTNFYEPYGFTPDDQHVIFASDYGMPSWTDSQIFTIGVDGTGMSRLSPAGAPNGFFTNYNEFAFYMPGDNYILYGSTVAAPDGGVDYWMMHPDGTGSTRLTYFNFPWSTQAASGYTAVGGIAFDPNNPNRFVAGLAADSNAQTINADMVTVSPSPAPGLSKQYFSGQGFTQPLSTTDNNPSDAFTAVGSPAAGVPASQYSIRWIGTLTPPTSGVYSLCAVAEFSDQLYVNGRQIVDGTYSYGQRRCGSVTLTSGAPVAIRMDYEHGSGTSYGQLSWILPGATAATPIDASYMSDSTAAAAALTAAATTAATGSTKTTAARGSTQSANKTTAKAKAAAKKKAKAKRAKAKAKARAKARAKAAKAKRAKRAKAAKAKAKAKAARAKRAAAKRS